MLFIKKKIAGIKNFLNNVLVVGKTNQNSLISKKGSSGFLPSEEDPMLPKSEKSKVSAPLKIFLIFKSYYFFF